MPHDFSGRTVMITGASGGLGQAVTAHFAASGASLVLSERSPDSAQALMNRLDVPADRYLIAAVDAADPASVDTAVAQAVARFGRIDILAHTVGGYAAGKPVHEAGMDVWDRMMALNARAVYVTCGSVARHMVTAGVRGSIVVVLARAALKGGRNQAAYAASKAAAQRIVESMAAELLEHGIRVNAVLPGTIDTPANRESMPNADFSKWVAPERIADAIAFLASDAAAAISGDSLAVYGRS